MFYYLVLRILSAPPPKPSRAQFIGCAFLGSCPMEVGDRFVIDGYHIIIHSYVFSVYPHSPPPKKTSRAQFIGCEGWGWEAARWWWEICHLLITHLSVQSYLAGTKAQLIRETF